MKKYYTKSKRYLLLIPVVLTFSLVLNEEVRSQIRSALNPHSRVILSVINADVLKEGVSSKILKIKTPQGIRIEVYSRKQTGDSKLVTSYQINDLRDGYFNFNGRATNLAIDDVDNDGMVEILVPTFDENLTAHLNILKYDSTTKSLQRITR